MRDNEILRNLRTYCYIYCTTMDTLFFVQFDWSKVYYYYVLCLSIFRWLFIYYYWFFFFDVTFSYGRIVVLDVDLTPDNLIIIDTLYILYRFVRYIFQTNFFIIISKLPGGYLL